MIFQEEISFFLKVRSLLCKLADLSCLHLSTADEMQIQCSAPEPQLMEDSAVFFSTCLQHFIHFLALSRTAVALNAFPSPTLVWASCCIFTYHAMLVSLFSLISSLSPCFWVP